MQQGAAYWMGIRHFDDENPLFLAQVQRGITNFVKILTEKNIPVHYATSGDSMTDGETVYISSNIKEDTIDYTVGLALHEASHVLLTDFGYLNQEKGLLLEKRFNIPKEDVNNVFTLINFVEDKRIDNFIHSTAPGYQFYYEELYRKAFYNSVVDKGLKENTHSTPTWNAYFFRIINIFNQNSNLDALPGLKEIRDLLTYKCVDSMKSTQDAVEKAIQIYNIIKPHIQEEEKEESNKDNNKKSSLEDKIDKHVDKQKNFINANYRKKRVNKKQQSQINKIANSNTKFENTELGGGESLTTIVTHDWKNYFSHPQVSKDGVVNSGFNLGKKLLTKLKNLATENNDVLNNLPKGRLDSRRLYQASFSEDLFYRIEKEKYKNTFLHLSIDLSGSMHGDKIDKTLQTTIALAYVACHLDNFDVEISFRGTDVRNDFKIPVLAYAFNSKINSVRDLKEFRYVYPEGYTPEGICLEYVRKNLPSPTHDTNVYLLNISDGMPQITGVLSMGELVEYTQKVVNHIKRNDIGVLSYFISSGGEETTYTDSIQDHFKTMYGSSAKFIDINNANDISNTINNMLISGEKIKSF